MLAHHHSITVNADVMIRGVQAVVEVAVANEEIIHDEQVIKIMIGNTNTQSQLRTVERDREERIEEGITEMITTIQRVHDREQMRRNDIKMIEIDRGMIVIVDNGIWRGIHLEMKEMRHGMMIEDIWNTKEKQVQM